jgi:3-oxoacyl-[acyl-carrier protein] reductase
LFRRCKKESLGRKGIPADWLGRVGQPEDISPAAVFFASNDSAWITGESLVIAGGLR